MTKNIKRSMLAMLWAIIVSLTANAQVTTSEIIGVVSDQNGASVSGATITAIHQPSGTKYSTVSNDDGRYTFPGLRVGGPYTVTVSSGGFKEQKFDGVMTSLGNATTVNVTMSVAEATAEVVVTSSDTFSEVRTGSSTNIGLGEVTSLPTIGRRVNDFAKLSPFYGGGPFGGSIAGQDNRLNNITVDGSYLNNSFGLGGQPGDRTNVSPISLDAIQEFQINVAPYDVRQGNFTGAGINTVTKSGSNQFHGSGYYNFRTDGMQGKNAGSQIFPKGELDYKLWGFTLGGPLPFFNFGENNGPAFISGRNKLFFFGSYEKEETVRPAHTFKARQAGQASGGSVSRVLASDLDGLANFLRTKFGYDPGAYQDYSFAIPAKKGLFRTDWNIDDKNRLTLRYLHLDSLTDQNLSTSNSGGTAGFGRQGQGTNFLSFQNTNYRILENIRSFVGEWTSSLNSQTANSLIIGYTKQDESRPNVTALFPFVEIHDGSTGTLSANTAYTAFGYEPFTPLNTLKYNSLQVQDNLSYYRGSHSFQAGISFEKYHSLNIFFPSSQSVYSYRSLQNFYDDANAFINNVPSPVTVARFNVRFVNQPGLTDPVQPLDVKYLGAYGQDQWRAMDNLTLTFGLRMEVPFFGSTGFKNSLVDTLTFRDGDGAALKLQTEKLPGRNVLWSPRFGVNWSPLKSQKLQLRGGTGFFSARPPYVWVSNQIGNNGVLTGIQSLDATTTRRFSPNPNFYKPATVTGAPIAGQQDLNFTVPGYKFPQIWRSSAAIDYKLPLGLIVGTEYIYSKDVNGTAYINANLSAPDGAFAGPDARPRWIADTCPTVGGVQTRVNCDVIQAITLKNQSDGKAWNLAFTLEKSASKGFYAKGGYAYGESKNEVDASSTAGTSFSSILTSGNANKPGLGFSNVTMGHRVFASASYHIEYFKFGGTTVSAFWESRTQSTNSYRVSNDLNGDGLSNDLLYIQKDPSETSFVPNGSFTAAAQSAAWEAFIAQDSYLSKHRGEYAVRGAAYYPIIHSLDFSVAQDIYAKFFKARHKFQIRADIINFGNLLNKNWGGGRTPVNNNFAPLAYAGSVDAQGRPNYRLNLFNNQLITSTFARRVSAADVYTLQLGFRYQF